MEIERLLQEAGDAMQAGRSMRIVLKGSEVLEGVPERIRGYTRNWPPVFDPPKTAEEAKPYGRVKHVIVIAGTEILAQEVAEFTLLDAAA
jgi:hypothetical protein